MQKMSSALLITTSGAAIGSVAGIFRFFAGFNVRPSKAFNPRHAGVYDWLTLGIPFVLEYWAGRGLDKSKELKAEGKTFRGNLLGLVSGIVKLPLAAIRWGFGAAMMVCGGGLIVKIGMSIRSAWKNRDASESSPRSTNRSVEEGDGSNYAAEDGVSAGHVRNFTNPTGAYSRKKPSSESSVLQESYDDRAYMGPNNF
jgi:hypothetical protein